MGQIVSAAAKPKRCNINQLSQVPTPAAGEYILVSSDNSMNAAGQGNFDSYIVGDGKTAATALPLHRIADLADSIEEGVEYGDSTSASASAVQALIFGTSLDHNLTEGYFLKFNSATHIPIQESIYWGYTDFIPAKNGDTIKSIFGTDGTNTSGIVCIAFYDENKNALNAWTIGGYNNERYGMIINNANAAYIRGNIYLSSKENCGVFVNGVQVWGYGYSVDGLEKRVESVETDIETMQGEIDELKEQLPEGRFYLPILSLINSDTKNGYISSTSLNAKRVTTESAMCIPLEGKTWHVILPTGYSLYLWLGNSAGAGWATNTGGWLVNGSTFTTGTNKSYRVVFRKETGSTNVPASEIQALVDSGEAAIYTEFSQDDVVTRNKTKTIEVDALKRVLLATLADNGMNSMPIFAHISDLHGDVQRLENCLQYCDHLGVDALFASGDTTLYRSDKDFTSFQPEIAAKHETDFLFCIGNHEAYPTGQTDIFTKHMAALVSRYNYLKSSGTPTDVCYWYKDYASRSIRVITIDYYNDGVYNGSIGQAQIDWFINTLLSTPTGYGVIVMLHSPEDKVTAVAPYDVFRQKHRVTTYQENGFYVGNRPIMNIVDAFISKASISESYTENSTTVNVVADFSSMDASTEFIAYVCGHRHEDWVGYYEHSVNKQLCLDITTGNAMYGDSANPAWSNQSDLPRGGESVCQDAFNLYAIDRAGGCVKIVRIGADITETFDERRMMVIPYKD